MAAEDLYELANEYLRACADALALTEAGTPERVCLSPGPPAWDCCDQLTVHVGMPGISVGETRVDPGALGAGHRVASLQMVNLVTMTATILRCAPTVGQDGSLPTVEQMNDASKRVYEDVWAVWNYCADKKRKAQLFAPKEREFYFDSALAQNQLGACCGWAIPIRVQLNGWRAYSE